MTAEVQKKSHHHHVHHHGHHHHSHPHKKMVSLRSIERITNLPVVESAHAYYEKIKNSNTLIKWSLIPAETGVWLAVETAMPVVNYFEKPVTAIDSIFCHGLDVIEANLPIVKYPPDLVYSITKDYVNSKVVSPVLKRADSVKQLSISGANNFGEIAAYRLNNAIDVADKYVDKYLPDISDAPDSTSGVSEKESEYGPHNPKGTTLVKPFLKPKMPIVRTDIRKTIKRLHVYSDGHGRLLADKLKKVFPLEVDTYVNVNPGASSSYIVESAIKGTKCFTKSDAVVLIAGLDDVIIGGDCERLSKEFLENIKMFVEKSASTFAFVCPILFQYDLPQNGVINKTIIQINNQLKAKLAGSDHAAVLNIFPLRRRYFNKAGIHLTGKGKGLLASVIRSAVNRVVRRIKNDPSNMAGNPNNKTEKTFQHVNQFGRKLQRRLTRRTIAEAKALKQQGADTIRCLVYLVDLLARDPKLFMEKAKEMWLELSKDEPENQLPPRNLEQLVAMLTREMSRRVVHLTNYTGAMVVLFSQYGMHAAHIGALNAVWWADHIIKAMHLESAMEATATQITRIHHVSIELLERIMEIIKNLKTESLKSGGNEAPGVAPQQNVFALPPPPLQSTITSTQQLGLPPRTSSVSSISSTSSYTSSSTSVATPTPSNKEAPSQNGDTHTNTTFETKHKTVIS